MKHLTYWNSTIKISRPKYGRVMPKVKRKGKKRSKLPSITSIKDKAWNCFSLFIRARDKKCVLCGSIKGFSAGHLISRQRTPVKFDENNVFGLCSTCNFKDRFVEGYHDVFVAWYIDNYGALPYTDLVERSKGTKQMKRVDYELLIKKYGRVSESKGQG